MICQRAQADRLVAQSFERFGKGRWIADTAKSRHAPAGERFQRCSTAIETAQPKRPMRRFDPEGMGREAANFLGDRLPLGIADQVGPGEDNHLGSRKTGQRLAERAAGKDVIEAKRFQGVDQDNIQIATEPAVLKSVVQQNRLGLVPLDRLPGRRHTVAILQMWHLRQRQGQLAGLVIRAAGLGPITAADDRHPQPPLDEPPGDPGHHGSFAGSPQGQVADADHCRRHAGLMPRIVVMAVAQPDGRGVGNLGQPQQRSLDRGDGPAAPTADQLAKVGGNLSQNQSAAVGSARASWLLRAPARWRRPFRACRRQSGRRGWASDRR